MYRTRMLIIAEGFESRALSWLQMQPSVTLFARTLICRYSPSEKSQYVNMLNTSTLRTETTPITIDFNRFDPSPFEAQMKELIESNINDITEVIIDVSAMSKMLIMIVFNLLRDYEITVRTVYSEPETWGPSEAEYTLQKKLGQLDAAAGLSSTGICNIVRTPKLSSVAMQDSPSILIAFTSTNGRLLSALVRELTPYATLLINATNDREQWRTDAALEINSQVIQEYPLYQNQVFSCGLLDFRGTFEFLAHIYRDNCYSNRIVIAPIGGKIHAVACAIIRNCCPDIHVEYPTPQSYLSETYSSDTIRHIYEINFPTFSNYITELAEEYNLNG